VKYRIDQLTLPVTSDISADTIRNALAAKLHLPENAVTEITILRRSIDARKRQELRFVFSVAFLFSQSAPAAVRKKAVQKYGLKEYRAEAYPYPVRGTYPSGLPRPVIAGTGPAGLFCGYFLAMAGLEPILLERGKPVEERTKTVERFWNGGELDPDCNVQFGEGGAGTFSDGKLNSSVLGKNPAGNEVLRIFVKYGADEDILYSNKPHIGTDRLKTVITAMRTDMVKMGAEFRFSARLEAPVIKDGGLRAVRIMEQGEIKELPADTLALCIGHSARDTFLKLHEKGVVMEQKPFAVGLRIQHPQDLIDAAQYGTEYRKAGIRLPAADYKLTMSASSGRGVYSFCMCPGGYVVNASSETGRLAVNGMSDRARDSEVANSAIVAAVDGSIFGTDLFDGMRFQRKMEEEAYRLGGGAIPTECVGDYLSAAGTLNECDPENLRIKGAYRYAALHELLPAELYRDLCEGITYFGTKIRGFDDASALLAGVESRTSSPIRILRDESGQCSLKGIYPCGEGAGYAGGITSAAADGIRIAEKIISVYNSRRS